MVENLVTLGFIHGALMIASGLAYYDSITYKNFRHQEIIIESVIVGFLYPFFIPYFLLKKLYS